MFLEAHSYVIVVRGERMSPFLYARSYSLPERRVSKSWLTLRCHLLTFSVYRINVYPCSSERIRFAPEG